MHLPGPTGHFEAESPFDYAAQAEVLIVTDIGRNDIAALAGAYARLIEAAEGGTLGLFTAIQRLQRGPCADRRPAGARRPAAARPACRSDRHRHLGRHFPRRSARVAAGHRRAARRRRCARRIAAAGGDGARALAAPDGAARGAAAGNGGSAYDDRVVRARLAQAFGRLIRRAGGQGAVRDPVERDAVAAADGVSAWGQRSRGCRSMRRWSGFGRNFSGRGRYSPMMAGSDR